MKHKAESDCPRNTQIFKPSRSCREGRALIQAELKGDAHVREMRTLLVPRSSPRVFATGFCSPAISSLLAEPVAVRLDPIRTLGRPGWGAEGRGWEDAADRALVSRWQRFGRPCSGRRPRRRRSQATGRRKRQRGARISGLQAD